MLPITIISLILGVLSTYGTVYAITGGEPKEMWRFMKEDMAYAIFNSILLLVMLGVFATIFFYIGIALFLF